MIRGDSDSIFDKSIFIMRFIHSEKYRNFT